MLSGAVLTDVGTPLPRLGSNRWDWHQHAASLNTRCTSRSTAAGSSRVTGRSSPDDVCSSGAQAPHKATARHKTAVLTLFRRTNMLLLLQPPSRRAVTFYNRSAPRRRESLALLTLQCSPTTQ